MNQRKITEMPALGLVSRGSRACAPLLVSGRNMYLDRQLDFHQIAISWKLESFGGLYWLKMKYHPWKWLHIFLCVRLNFVNCSAWILCMFFVFFCVCILSEKQAEQLDILWVLVMGANWSCGCHRIKNGCILTVKTRTFLSYCDNGSSGLLTYVCALRVPLMQHLDQKCMMLVREEPKINFCTYDQIRPIGTFHLHDIPEFLQKDSEGFISRMSQMTRSLGLFIISFEFS